VAQAFPATGPGGRGGPSCAAGCRGEEEGEKGRGEGSGPRADAGPRRLGKAPSPAGEGWTTTTMKTMTKMTIWPLALASARA
jgi:hypothetical protein